jgi:hypothetical protein
MISAKEPVLKGPAANCPMLTGWIAQSNRCNRAARQFGGKNGLHGTRILLPKIALFLHGFNDLAFREICQIRQILAGLE